MGLSSLSPCPMWHLWSCHSICSCAIPNQWLPEQRQWTCSTGRSAEMQKAFLHREFCKDHSRASFYLAQLHSLSPLLLGANCAWGYSRRTGMLLSPCQAHSALPVKHMNGWWLGWGSVHYSVYMLLVVISRLPCLLLHHSLDLVCCLPACQDLQDPCKSVQLLHQSLMWDKRTAKNPPDVFVSIHKSHTQRHEFAIERCSSSTKIK